MATICIEMGWDYLTYRKQPIWFIDTIKDILVNRNKNDNAKITDFNRRTR